VHEPVCEEILSSHSGSCTIGINQNHNHIHNHVQFDQSQRSDEMKRLLMLGVFVLVQVLLPGCKGIDPCEDPMLGGDCYYTRHDPGFATAQANIQESAINEARATQQAIDARTTPAWQPPATATSGPMTTDAVLCADVQVDGTFFSTIVLANEGTFPPETYVGLTIQAGYELNGTITVQPIADAMKDAPIVHVGDRICIGVNPDIVRQAVDR
jgi:hypothetical protein